MKNKSLASIVLAATLGFSGCKVYESILDEPKTIVASGKVTTITHMSIDPNLLRDKYKNMKNAAYTKNVNYSINTNMDKDLLNNIKDNLIFDLIDIETLDPSHTDIPILVKYNYYSDFSDPDQQDKIFHSSIKPGDTINIMNSQNISKEKSYIPVDKGTLLLMEFYIVPYDRIVNTCITKVNSK